MQSFFKKKRIKDEDVLEFIRSFPCLVCKKRPSDPDHITTKGAGGDDILSNLWPLCREHHMLRHSKGIIYMAENYECCKYWLDAFRREDKYERSWAV